MLAFQAFLCVGLGLCATLQVYAQRTPAEPSSPNPNPTLTLTLTLCVGQTSPRRVGSPTFDRASALAKSMAQPSKPVVVQLRPSELVLLWEPGSDTAGAEGYCVELRHSLLPDGVTHGAFGSWEVAVPNTWSLHPACHLRDLRPESYYEFRVAAVNGTSGASPASDPILTPADAAGRPAMVATAAARWPAGAPGQRRPTAALDARETRREQPSEPAAVSRRAAGPSTARTRRRSPSPEEQGKTSRSATGLAEGQKPRARRSRATKPSGAAPAQERGKGTGRRKAGGRQPGARASGGHSGGGGGGGGGGGLGGGGVGEGERAPVAALNRALDAPIRVIVPERKRRW